MINSDYIWLYGVTVILDYDYLCVYIIIYIVILNIFQYLYLHVYLILYLSYIFIYWRLYEIIIHTPLISILDQTRPKSGGSWLFLPELQRGGHLLRGCWEDGTHGCLVGLLQDFKGARLERHLGRFCGMLMDFDLGMLLWTLDRSPAISWMVCRRCHSATVMFSLWFECKGANGIEWQPFLRGWITSLGAKMPASTHFLSDIGNHIWKTKTHTVIWFPITSLMLYTLSLINTSDNQH